MSERIGEESGGARSQTLRCTIYDLSLYIAVTLDVCMMEFFRVMKESTIVLGISASCLYCTFNPYRS
jgi:hypothetical protein